MDRWIKLCSRTPLRAAELLLFVCSFCLNAGASPVTTTAARSDQSTGTLNTLADVGKELFSDKHLSVDGTMSCADCHVPDRYFIDGRATAHDRNGKAMTRNVPTLLNVMDMKTYSWDGRSETLAAQIRAPFINSAELGLRTEGDAAEIIKRNARLTDAFQRIAGVRAKDLSFSDVEHVIESYLATLTLKTSAYDRYRAGNPNALSASAERGLGLFTGAAGCADCHTLSSTNDSLTDQDFHPSSVRLPEGTVGRLPELTERVRTLREGNYPDELSTLISTDSDVAGLGRYAVVLNVKDIGKYRTPSLRNVAVTAPYMHDGSIQTLEDALDYELYSRTNEDGSVRPLDLAYDEKLDLLAFLRSLTSDIPKQQTTPLTSH